MALFTQCQTAGWRTPCSLETTMAVTVAAGTKNTAGRDAIAERVDGILCQTDELEVNSTVGVVGRCRCTAIVVADVAVEGNLGIFVVGVRTGLVRLGVAAAARSCTAPGYCFVVSCGWIENTCPVTFLNNTVAVEIGALAVGFSGIGKAGSGADD